MPVEYADSNVWIAILQGEPLAGDVRTYFHELRKSRHALITSILSLTETSVRAYKLRQPAKAEEYAQRINRIAQVVQITPEIAKTAAMLEAKYGVSDSGFGPKIGRWDALHLATAIVYRCSRFLTFDEDLLRTDFSSEPYVPNLLKPVPQQGTLRL